MDGVPASHADEEVVSVATEDLVVAGCAARVVGSLAVEVVTEDLVVTAAAAQQVVASEAEDEVVSVEADDDVWSGCADGSSGPEVPVIVAAWPPHVGTGGAAEATPLDESGTNATAPARARLQCFLDMAGSFPHDSA